MSEKCQRDVGCRGYSRTMYSRSTTAEPPAYLRRIDSPIGRIEITSDGDAVTTLSIERAGHLPWEEVPERTTTVLDLAATQLGEYFAGTRTNFDVPVRLNGTEFQRSVWNELAQLPFGGVVSYGEIGTSTGRATAGRAVGGAVGANPVPIIVPCHRVLASNGRITGYSGGNGVPTKVWLLDHEGIEHRS
ncbi:MAG: methylated-DNA--[protein]-cysteine S-methyltransferase [Rhodoglobus sp.]|nr:methylated-DNA--[protein]-cysteine S-methyltransferase [Rhodoglobus sp.]